MMLLHRNVNFLSFLKSGSSTLLQKCDHLKFRTIFTVFTGLFSYFGAGYIVTLSHCLVHIVGGSKLTSFPLDLKTAVPVFTQQSEGYSSRI